MSDSGGGATAPLPRMQGRIAGRYEPTKILGRGGMGIVYKAHDHVLQEDTAIKLLLPTLVGDPKNAERLVREIKTARQITHPNVIRIHDFGLDGDEGYVSMEILPGGSLHERLAHGLLPIAEGLEIALGICDGLAAAHQKGIIHRDLKPHTVLFDSDGRPKIVDFGLARLADTSGQTQGFTGTPLYMSPEMTDGREITTRSDVYSLGVMLFEVFTGQPPFKGDTLMRLAMLHSNEPPPRPSSIRAEVPAGLETILFKALQKQPNDRFSNAREFGDALREFKSTGAAGSITIPIAPLPLPQALPLPAPPRAGRRRLSLYAVATVVVVAAIVYGLVNENFRVTISAETPLAVATPTATLAVATATPAPTAVTTQLAIVATPAKTRTPKPTPDRTAVALATPQTTAAAPARKGRLCVRGNRNAQVLFDDLAIGDTKTVRVGQSPVPAGKHKLTVVWGATSATRDIDVVPGADLHLYADGLEGKITLDESCPNR